MHITMDQIVQVGGWITAFISIDAIIKQVALKQGNTKLVTWCDLIANDLNEVLLVIQAIPSLFNKSTPTTGPVEAPKTGA
jgi:hypothetical protein